VLTERLVLELRRRHAAGGVTYHQLATEVGAHERTVALAIQGITWRHVGSPDEFAARKKPMP